MPLTAAPSYLLTAYCLVLTTYYSLLTTHYSLLLTTHDSRLTTHHSPLTTHHSPLTTHHLQVHLGAARLPLRHRRGRHLPRHHRRLLRAAQRAAGTLLPYHLTTLPHFLTTVLPYYLTTLLGRPERHTRRAARAQLPARRVGGGRVPRRAALGRAAAHRALLRGGRCATGARHARAGPPPRANPDHNPSPSPNPDPNPDPDPDPNQVGLFAPFASRPHTLLRRPASPRARRAPRGDERGRIRRDRRCRIRGSAGQARGP
eukprot:scaffold56493_cov43-Phaeocystis_antarctica.AAC.1